MARAEDEHNAQVRTLLAAAAQTIANMRHSWLVTAAGAGATSARPMGRLVRDVDVDDWVIRFITDGRSRKAAEIRRAGRATVIFQKADDAFVSLVGSATLREEASEVAQRLKNSYDAYFSSEQERANAALIEIDVQRMELWIRGVTPEPFGSQSATLERYERGAWRLTQKASR